MYCRNITLFKVLPRKLRIYLIILKYLVQVFPINSFNLWQVPESRLQILNNHLSYKNLHVIKCWTFELNGYGHLSESQVVLFTRRKDQVEVFNDCYEGELLLVGGFGTLDQGNEEWWVLERLRRNGSVAEDETLGFQLSLFDGGKLLLEDLLHGYDLLGENDSFGLFVGDTFWHWTMHDEILDVLFCNLGRGTRNVIILVRSKDERRSNVLTTIVISWGEAFVFIIAD